MLGFINKFDTTRNIDIIGEFAKKILFGKSVLEIGSGGGEVAVLLSRLGCKVIGVDVVDIRKPNFSDGYCFLIGDGRALPFANESFDAVVSFDVIEHIDGDELFLSEAYRVCQKGGILILGTPNRNRLSNKIRQLLGKRIAYPLEIGEGCIHLREYTMDEFSRLVKKVGFKVTKEEYVWFGLVGIIGFKRFPAFLNKWIQGLLVFAVKP